MIDSLYRLLKGIRNYRNPIQLAFQRAMHASVIEVVDRKTGLRFKCRPGADRMLSETFHARIYNVPIAPLKDGDIVVDIGANHGFYSCWAAAQGAIVHAFEPDPNTYDLLLQNVQANGLEDKVIAHPYAVASETGDLQLFCTDHLGGGMSTIIPAFAIKSGMQIASQASIQALSMRDVLDLCKIDRVRICKMDCEGAELSILAGMTPQMRDRFDAVVLEYHPQAYELPKLIDVLLSWEGYNVNTVVSQERDMGNANLSLIRADLLREWSLALQGPASRETSTGVRAARSSAWKKKVAKPESKTLIK